jgi:cysteine desulfurase
MKRFYLDHNATTKPVDSFVSDLAAGKVAWANPSSAHKSGKDALKQINSTKKKIFDFFNLSSDVFEIIFHSGATEAANTFLKSKKLLIYFGTDHACARSVAQNCNSYMFPINTAGKFDEDELIQFINTHEVSPNDIVLHYNLLNSETGIIWELPLAVKIKEKTGCSVYVDATQAVGRMEGAQVLDASLDVYSFSAHKFGALKGIGFSLVKKSFSFEAYILGGGQQNNLRSGTLNTHAIVSIGHALDDAILMTKKQASLLSLKHKIIELLIENKNIITIPNDSLNTICFLHKSMKADALLIYFDRHGLDVSSGSACSAGSIEPSSTLVAMGLHKYAKSSIRLSLGYENILDSDEILKRLSEVLEKIS